MTTENDVNPTEVVSDKYITEDVESIRAEIAADEANSEPKEQKTEEPEKVAEEEPKERSDKPQKPGRVERENARLRQELEAYKSQSKQEIPDNKSQKTDDGPPKIEDYADAMDYYDARQDYKIAQAIEDLKGQQTEAQKQELKDIQGREFDRREALIIDENPDYSENLAELVDVGFINDPMIDYIKHESTIGEKVSLHFTKYPKDAQVISTLKGKEFDKAMWAIEHFISTNQSEGKAAVRTTKAPQPITPVRANAISSKDESDMSYEEYQKARRERRKAQGLN